MARRLFGFFPTGFDNTLLIGCFYRKKISNNGTAAISEAVATNNRGPGLQCYSLVSGGHTDCDFLCVRLTPKYRNLFKCNLLGYIMASALFA